MSKTPRGLRVDGEMTRTRILDAAGELFAATGFAETTNKAIATRADVDLASINYHFGSRNGLYQAVLIEAHRRIIDVANLQQLAQSTLSAADKLKALINQIIQRAMSDSGGWHLVVLAAEILSPSSHIEVIFQSEVSAKAAVVLGILSDVTKIPKDDPALLRCVLSVMAPCLILLIGRRGLPGPVREVLRMPQDIIVEHLCRFSIAGLEAIGQDHATK